MKDGFAIFDTHTHVGDARHSGRRQSADRLLREMDRYGVDRSLVIPFPVVEDYRVAHDEIAQAVRKSPSRLVGAACLYPYIPEAEFRAEVRRCREDFGFGALKLQPQYHGLNPSSSRSDFFFETALENRMAVVIHTGSGIPFALPSLIMPAAKKYPDLPVVLAHCGGGGLLFEEAIVAAMFCPNIYLELSSLLPHQVLEVLRHIRSERLMIGSDLIENLDIEMAKILWLDIPDEQKRNILSATAERVLGAG
jgi:predicted TIM-barrel fold metal-dependent hydrolase